MKDKIGLYLLTLCGQLCHPLGGLALCDTGVPGEVWGPGHDVISCHYVWTELASVLHLYVSAKTGLDIGHSAVFRARY